MPSELEDNPQEETVVDDRRVTPREVFEEFKKRFTSAHDDEKRGRERYPWATRITIWARHESGSGPPSVKLDTATSEISGRGLSFFLPTKIKVPVSLSIRFNELEDLPVLDGIARNAIRFGDSFYRIGVELIG